MTFTISEDFEETVNESDYQSTFLHWQTLSYGQDFQNVFNILRYRVLGKIVHEKW